MPIIGIDALAQKNVFSFLKFDIPVRLRVGRLQKLAYHEKNLEIKPIGASLKTIREFSRILYCGKNWEK